ncbi:hypothetical protein [Pseudomonas japonica]|uniref:hypothetical protein n=1 Tax=Pseudomonas japonica TaxID=256466 RepID=UPI000A51DC46|nr:hypothetical protein [Pseudomonas japonica]
MFQVLGHGDQLARAAAWASLWTFVAPLCGAFFASLAALWGGRQRDRVIILIALFVH